MLTIPAVVSGVAVALWITRTTLNIQSLMGAIMAIGVAVANAILLVTFAERYRIGGAEASMAAVSGAASRLRPILMTSCAMIAGMLPMAIGLGEGGDQSAPLGRAVIGGLERRDHRDAADPAGDIRDPAKPANAPGRFASSRRSRSHLPMTAARTPEPDSKPSRNRGKFVSSGSTSRDDNSPEPSCRVRGRPRGTLLVVCPGLCAGAACRGGGSQCGAAVSRAATGATAGQQRRFGTAGLVVPATIQAFFATDLYAKDSGYISQINADIGDHVKKGDVLAVIDDPELQQQFARTQAAVQQASAALDVAKRRLVGLQADRALQQVTLKRWELLFAGKAVTAQQLDEQRAKENVSARTSRLDRPTPRWRRPISRPRMSICRGSGPLVEYTKIVAPFDGIITRRLINPGDLVQSATATRPTPGAVYLPGN